MTNKKFHYLVLEVNHIEYELSEEQKTKHCSYGSYTQNCSIKDELTGEVFQINRDTAENEMLRMINVVDYNDLIVGDRFHFGYPFELDNN